MVCVCWGGYGGEVVIVVGEVFFYCGMWLSCIVVENGNFVWYVWFV